MHLYLGHQERQEINIVVYWKVQTRKLDAVIVLEIKLSDKFSKCVPDLKRCLSRLFHLVIS